MTSVRHTTIHHPSRTVFNQISSVVYLRDTYCPACCGSGSYPPVLVSCVVTNYRSGGGSGGGKNYSRHYLLCPTLLVLLLESECYLPAFGHVGLKLWGVGKFRIGHRLIKG